MQLLPISSCLNTAYMPVLTFQGSLACREELNQPLFAAIDAFEYPELHDESIAARNFYRHLSKLMLACGVKDFGLKVCAHELHPLILQQLTGTATLLTAQHIMCSISDSGAVVISSKSSAFAQRPIQSSISSGRVW